MRKWSKLNNSTFVGNEHRLAEGVAYIKLRGSQANGREAIVDAADLDWLLSAGTWNYRQVTPTHAYPSAHRRGQKKGTGNEKVYMHRLIMGEPPRGVFVDHINGNTMDCRRGNLRIVTPGENNKNRLRHRIEKCPHCSLCPAHVGKERSSSNDNRR